MFLSHALMMMSETKIPLDFSPCRNWWEGERGNTCISKHFEREAADMRLHCHILESIQVSSSTESPKYQSHSPWGYCPILDVLETSWAVWNNALLLVYEGTYRRSTVHYNESLTYPICISLVYREKKGSNLFCIHRKEWLYMPLKFPRCSQFQNVKEDASNARYFSRLFLFLFFLWVVLLLFLMEVVASFLSKMNF